MIYLKEYYNYDKEVEEICKKYGIENWSIRDGLVDVDGYVYLGDRILDKLPLKFGRVSGYFYCSRNNLTSLEGGPNVVGGYFVCSVNNLSTLEGVPKELGGYFDCSNNNITTLEHFPKVSGDIYINDNPLPEEILNLPQKKLKKLVEEQDFYEIWRNGQLFLPRWKELKIDLGID